MRNTARPAGGEKKRQRAGGVSLLVRGHVNAANAPHGRHEGTAFAVNVLCRRCERAVFVERPAPQAIGNTTYVSRGRDRGKRLRAMILSTACDRLGEKKAANGETAPRLKRKHYLFELGQQVNRSWPGRDLDRGNLMTGGGQINFDYYAQVSSNHCKAIDSSSSASFNTQSHHIYRSKLWQILQGFFHPLVLPVRYPGG